MSILLASYLSRLGFRAVEVGAIVTATLLGSACLTLGAGLLGHRFARRTLLLGACVLMAVTGVAFAAFQSYGPLLVVAFIGTLNPSAGDVTLFLPIEQSALAQTTDLGGRTSRFAWYNLAGALAGSFGALAIGLTVPLSRLTGWSVVMLERAGFLGYAAVGALIGALYSQLTPSVEVARQQSASPLARSRATVIKLAALFSIDSFGGGFVVQSMLVLWLYKRFGLTESLAGTLFFASGLLSAFSQLASARLAARIGLVQTMVFTHLPSNVLLVLAGVVPHLPAALAFLLLRAAFSQMDVPARQSFVMSVVPPEERAAASSLTNVPRSVAAAIPPLFAGLLLERPGVGWSLVIAGTLKAIYDLGFLAQFRRVRALD